MSTTLALWGEISNSGPLLKEMMQEVAEDVAGAQIDRAAHWFPVENPSALVRHLVQFLA